MDRHLVDRRRKEWPYGKMQHMCQIWTDQQNCAGGNEEKGIHPKGMNHISHVTKVGMGKEYVW